MADDPLKKPKSSARRAAFAALYIVGLAAGILAAWQAHVAWRTPKEPPPSPRTYALPGPRITTEPAGTRPERLIDSLGGDVQKASGDDLKDAPPPPGARVGTAFSLHHGVGVVASYRWEGTVQAARDYYVTMLGAEPWHLLRESIPVYGGRILTFAGNRKSVVVSLRIDPQDAKIVDIKVTEVPQ